MKKIIVALFAFFAVPLSAHNTMVSSVSEKGNLFLFQAHQISMTFDITMRADEGATCRFGLAESNGLITKDFLKTPAGGESRGRVKIENEWLAAVKADSGPGQCHFSVTEVE